MNPSRLVYSNTDLSCLQISSYCGCGAFNGCTANALRQAANAIGNLKDTHLSDFFKRVAYRKGRQAAVSATARKLGVIIWTMATKKVPYSPPTEYLFLDQKRKMGIAKRIQKQMAKFDIKPEEIGIGNSLIPNYNF